MSRTMRNSEGYYDPTAGLALRNIERTDRMNNIRRGDVFYIERYQTTGSEQQAGRPALVVSNDMNNEHSDTVEIAYLTTQPKTELPTHAVIDSTSRLSIALCEQVTTVSKLKVGDYMCSVSAEEMACVDEALLISLDLDKGCSEAPAAPQEVLEPTPQPDIDFTDAYWETRAEGENLREQIIKLETEFRIYKGLYDDVVNKVLYSKS